MLKYSITNLMPILIAWIGIVVGLKGLLRFIDQFSDNFN